MTYDSRNPGPPMSAQARISVLRGCRLMDSYRAIFGGDALRELSIDCNSDFEKLFAAIEERLKKNDALASEMGDAIREQKYGKGL